MEDRVGVRWSEAEEHKLLESVAENKTDEELAQLHRRRVGGIRARKGLIASKFLNKGEDIEEVSSKVGLTVDEIKEITSNLRDRKRDRKKTTTSSRMEEMERKIDFLTEDYRNRLLYTRVNEIDRKIDMLISLIKVEIDGRTRPIDTTSN